MVNKARPHVFVLPEDDANRQLANGFHLGASSTRQFWVSNVAGGWNEVLNHFVLDHISDMERHNQRFMILLIDFDDQPDRLRQAKVHIPEPLIDRVLCSACPPNRKISEKPGLDPTKLSVLHWRETVEKTPTRLGATDSFGTTQLKLTAYASASARSCSNRTCFYSPISANVHTDPPLGTFCAA